MATSSIGTASRNYSTTDAWEAATDISISEIYNGELYDDSDFIGNGNITTFAGATGISATVYRTMYAATGQEYDILTDTGVYFTDTGKAGFIHMIQEQYFRLGPGIGYHQENDSNPGTDFGTVQLHWDHPNNRCIGNYFNMQGTSTQTNDSEAISEIGRAHV